MPLDLLPALDVLTPLATGPNVTPEQPPGTEGLTTSLNWVSWFVIFAGVFGFLISAGMLVVSSVTGREFASAKGLFLSIIGCILAVAVGGIMQTFV